MRTARPALAGPKAAPPCKGIAANFLACGVDLATVKPRTLFVVADNVIGSVNLFEFVLGFFVAGVHVGVQLFGQPPKCLVDFGL